jgi:hypothetical protein
MRLGSRTLPSASAQVTVPIDLVFLVGCMGRLASALHGNGNRIACLESLHESFIQQLGASSSNSSTCFVALVTPGAEMGVSSVVAPGEEIGCLSMALFTF